MSDAREWVREVTPGGPGWWHRRSSERGPCVCGLWLSHTETGDGEGDRHPPCADSFQLEVNRASTKREDP